MKTLIQSFKIAAFILTIVLFFSCEKDKNSTQQVCKTVKIALPITGSDTSFFYYTYDNSNRLIKEDFGSGLYSNYTWAADKVTAKHYTNNALSYTEVFTLGSDGLAISSTYTLAGQAVSKNTTYEYDDNGYLLVKTVTLASDENKYDTYTYEYEDGNLVNSTTEFYSGLPSTYNSYEYYTDKVDMSSNHVDILGKQSVNLLKKSTFTVGSTTIITQTTYEFYSDGKVKKRTSTIGSDSFVSIPFYECN